MYDIAQTKLRLYFWNFMMLTYNGTDDVKVRNTQWDVLAIDEHNRNVNKLSYKATSSQPQTPNLQNQCKTQIS